MEGHTLVIPKNHSINLLDMSEEDTLAGTQASAEGDFLLIGLTSGTYDLSVTPADEGLNPTVMPNVNVIAPDTTSVGTIELQGVE